MASSMAEATLAIAGNGRDKRQPLIDSELVWGRGSWEPRFMVVLGGEGSWLCGKEENETSARRGWRGEA